MNLRELGEDRLVAGLVADLQARSGVIAGPGDDCAVLAAPKSDRLLLFKTDCVVERVHFLPNEKPAAIGWKAMARTLSDFAAMSGVPEFALVTLVTPPERSAKWVKDLYRGLRKVADRFEVAIVGGETSATDGPAVISLSALGSVEKNRWVSRRGGQAGDALYVTGKLGGAIRHRHLHFLPRLEEARWLTRNFQVHAMMDLSDGLGADVPRLARASKVGFELDEAALPRNRGCTIEQAINDGEDYELLFALAPNDSTSLQKKWRKRFPRLPLTRIGSFHRQLKKEIGNPHVATFISPSAEKTIAFAREWSSTLQPNDVVALCGDLGAGKTHFVKGLVAGLGSDDVVTSPTFTLLHEYRGGRLTVYHFDFYRIERAREIEQIGFDDHLSDDGIAVIEWADRFQQLLPARTQWVRLESGEGDTRSISLAP